ncbi:MAG TPA: hypothetical protein DCM59_11370 [Clostridium sp.]|nr:hypothetical protein [Clostridium sp.]
MRRSKKRILTVVFVCLLFVLGFYGCKTISEISKFYLAGGNDFIISQIDGKAETTFWTDNTKDNIYDIKFQVFNGTDLKEITPKKSTYKMKINSTIDNGELGIKIYNNKKVLLDTNESIDKTISVSDSKNVKIELTGKKAKGQVKITLT